MTTTDKHLLAFTLIFLSSALWPILPHYTLIIVAFFIVNLCVYMNVSAWITGALLGFLWASFTGYWYTSLQLNESWFDQNLLIEGQVVSVQRADVHADTNSVRFNVALNRVGRSAIYHSPKVRLSWYRAPEVPKQGQIYRFLVKLKSPAGLANPNTFHYQTWLASKNIVATGYIIESESNTVLSSQHSLRQRSIDRLSALPLEHTQWLQALSFGYRGGFSDSDWSMLQSTGTAHLFAISGLHVGIVFSYGFFIAAKLLASVNVIVGYQHQATKLASVCAALLCMFYGYLAGYEVPVSRAVLAMALYIYLVLTESYWRLTSILLYLLVTFFVLFPFSILGVSFWFSFIAVLSIWVYLWRFPQAKAHERNESNERNESLEHKNRWFSLFSQSRLKQIMKQVFLLQLWLCVVTVPLTIYIFEQLPLLSLIANLILVPWVSIVLVPLCLLATLAMVIGLSETIYSALYMLADNAMSLTLSVMEYAVTLTNTINIETIHFDIVVVLILLSTTLILLMPFWPLKKTIVFVAFGFIATTLFLPNNSLSEATYPKLTVFDVGQGSAALFTFVDSENQAHTWLFDTGASFPSGFSMAKAVILPNLEAENITSIDKVFLSHLDNDHAGGLRELKANVQLKKVLSPETKCNVHRSDWLTKDEQAISIDILWPMVRQSGDENNHSCVIKLSIGGKSVLFSGDIESQAEQDILSHIEDKSRLQSSILIAPHHGSRTSSTQAFIEAVKPELSVFAAGAQNRWGFPHPEVVQRHHQFGSETFTTGREGAIQFVFKTNELKVNTYRGDTYSRWYFKARK